LSAHALGKRWWGITAALTIWLLHFTEAMRGELSLENVTVLAFLGLALCYVFALRGHWIAAAAAIGLSLSVKPLLLVVLLVFLLARQWKAFAVAVAIRPSSTLWPLRSWPIQVGSGRSSPASSTGRVTA